MINAAVCNAFDRAGCDRAWPTFNVGNYAQDLRVDEATDTIYVVNAKDNTVSVVNGATCNATNSSGCGQTPALVNVGSFPFALAIDELTNTIYVVNAGDNTVSVIDGATCDGSNTSGCGQTPPTVAVGNGPDGVAVNPLTNTIYVANGVDNTVSVIDGATCDAEHAGCGQTPQTVAVGSNPVSDRRRSADRYRLRWEHRRQHALADQRRHLQRRRQTGCAQTAPAVYVEQLPFGIAVNQQTDTAYITSIVDADVATINGRTCNTARQTGCRPTPVPERMGGWGGAIALDPTAGTAYVPNNTDGTVSFFALGAGGPR